MKNVLVIGCCFGGNGEKLKGQTHQKIKSIMGPDDVFVAVPGTSGICNAYNKVLKIARNTTGCKTVVLLHDDTEINDPKFREKILNAINEGNIGAVGVVGGSELTSLAWWKSKKTIGKIHESRGTIDFNTTSGDVDAIDGLFMAISQTAFRKFEFDEENFPKFHGYDVDYCLTLRNSGLRVVVRPIDLFHRTKGGFGNAKEFLEANTVLQNKWSKFFHNQSNKIIMKNKMKYYLYKYKKTINKIFTLSNTRKKNLLDEVNNKNLLENPEFLNKVEINCICCNHPISGLSTLLKPILLRCEKCETVTIWPKPSRDVGGDGLFTEMYGNNRLKKRDTWFREAKSRLEWIQIYCPDGVLIEIGCGTGEFVKTAQDAGYEAQGLEVSKWAAAKTRDLGVKVFEGYLSDWISNNYGYASDVAAIWHVLEHIPDPLNFLIEIKSVLKSNGFLFIEVPNGTAADLDRLGIDWDGTQPKDHYHLFSPIGLGLLLDAAGFEVKHSIEFTARIYTSSDGWNKNKKNAFDNGLKWPSKDFIRIIASPKNSNTY